MARATCNRIDATAADATAAVAITTHHLMKCFLSLPDLLLLNYLIKPD